MTQQELREYLDRLAAALKKEDRIFLDARLHSLMSVFPFNEYEYILMFLRDRSVISLNGRSRFSDSGCHAGTRFCCRGWTC